MDNTMDRYELESAIRLTESVSSYFAFDSLLGMDVIITFIKLVSISEQTAKKITYKLCSLQEQKIQGVPVVTDFGFTETELFYACESTQAHPIPRNIDPISLANIVVDACKILGHLHQNGIAHGNITDETLLIRDDGSVVLNNVGMGYCDFAAVSERFTCLNYWPPERILSHKVTQKSDLYALGTVIYKILAGKLPYEELDIETQLSKIFYERPRPLREIDFGIPKRLETICLKLLEKNPEARHRDTNHLIFDLEHFIDGSANDSLRQQIVSKPFHPLIGRNNETDYFRNALQRALCENGTTLDLTINSGMGNSRLIQEFRTIATANDAIFIHTSQDRASGSIPAISQTLDDLSEFELQVDTELAEHLAKSLHSLSPAFVKSLSVDLSNSEQIKDSSVLSCELATLLCDALPEQTIVYAFENVSDPLTKEVIQNMSKLAEKKRVLLIVTHPAKTDIARKTDLVQRHELPPLTEADLSELSSQLCAVRLPYDEIHELRKITGGNPYHSTLLLNHLVKGEITSLKESPKTLRELQEQKWSGTSELGKHLLLRLSLLGKPTRISYLQQASDLKKDEFNIAFNELQDNGFIKESISGTQSVVKLASEGLAPLVKGTLPRNTEFIHHLHIAQAVEEHLKDNVNLDFELGELYIQANNCTKAAIYLIKVLKSHQSYGQTHLSNEVTNMLEGCIEHIQDPLVMLDALLVSINNQIECKNNDKIRKYTLLANELLKKHEFGAIKYCNALTAIAQAELFLGEYPRVIAALNRIKPVLDRTDYVDDRQAFLETSAKYHISQKQFKEAQESVNGLIEAATERQDKDCLFEAYCLMSDTMAINLSFEEAIFWLQKALALAKNMSNIVLERKAIDLIVGMQFKSGNIAQAIDALKHTINIEKNTKGIERQAAAYTKICNVLLGHSKISELRTVLASFADFLEENDSSKHRIDYYMAMIRLAIIDTRLEDAFEYVRKLEDLALSTGNPPILLKAMQLKGETFYLLGDHARAESMLKLAFELFETQEKELALKDHVATCYMLSKNHVQLGNLEQARECFHQGKKLEKDLMMAGIPFDHTLSGIAKLRIMQAMCCTKETVRGYAYSQSYFNKSKWVSAYEYAKSVLDKKTQNDFYTETGLVEFVLITGRIIHDRFLLSNVKDHEAIVYSKYAREKLDDALNFVISNGITLNKAELAQLRDDILRLKAGRVA